MRQKAARYKLTMRNNTSTAPSCAIKNLASCSSSQLYNEEVNDLLAAEGGKLQIHESREAGVHVAGLREEIVTSAEHVLALLEQGECARHVGETKMNKNSSRSHTVFRMVRFHIF